MGRFYLLVFMLNLAFCQESKDLFKDKDCAIVLSSAGAVVTGRDLCIRYSDVEEAFGLARGKVGLRFPARLLNDLAIAHLGTALQETTRILAKSFWLSRWEVENVLPRLETRKTEIGRYCGWPLRGVPGPCVRERYRRHDGTCNNFLEPTRGAALMPFKRLLPPLYADRISEARVGRDGSSLPLPRLVSTRVHADIFKRHDLRVSFMFPAWGQLVDHDLTLTAETKEPDSRKEFDCCAPGVTPHPNCYPLGIPRDDPFFKEKRQTCLNMARSLAGVRPGCALGSRVQINLLTSYIDGNFIYGSNVKLSESLRLFQKGQLKTFDAFPELGLKPILPPKTKQPDDGCIRPHPDIYCFLAGDNRVNEQLALGVLHTLAVREHNRIATDLSYINPHWDDEKIYQEARHIMAALIQHITYNEFLPQLLGEEYLEKYDLKLNPQGYIYSYDPEVDATIPASFGTAAFRFGHSLLPNAMQRRSPTHKLTGERKLSEMLQQPFDLYKPGWVDAYTLGMVNQVSQPMDQSITSEVTNHLFQEPARDFGRDLAAINLGRAREHGIPGYMAFRKHCGLDDMHSWQDMWSSLPNATVSEYLKIYDHPDDVDLWSAGVSEMPAPGSMLGPVFSCIIATTFRDLRKGDRFWYENRGFPSSFTMDQLREIKKYTLSRFLCNTGDNIETIQVKALLLPDYDENPRVSCKSGEIPQLNLKFWKETPISNEDRDKYPEKPHLVDYSTSTPPNVDDPWSFFKEKEKPSTLYGAPVPPSNQYDKDMYTLDSQVIYESDIKGQDKFPFVNEHDSLAFVMFSESDKYAIKQDYMYNGSSGGNNRYSIHDKYNDKSPVKGDLISPDNSYNRDKHPFKEQLGGGYGNPEKGPINYHVPSYNKYPYKGETVHNDKDPYEGVTEHYDKLVTEHYDNKDPYKLVTEHYDIKPHKGAGDEHYSKFPITEEIDPSDKDSYKPVTDHYGNDPYKLVTHHYDEEPFKVVTNHYDKMPNKGETETVDKNSYKGEADRFDKFPHKAEIDEKHPYTGGEAYYHKNPHGGDADLDKHASETDKYEKGPYEVEADDYHENPYNDGSDHHDNKPYDIKRPIKEFEVPLIKKPEVAEPEYFLNQYEKNPTIKQKFPTAEIEKYPSKERPEAYTVEKFPDSSLPDKHYSNSPQTGDQDKSKPEEYHLTKHPTKEPSHEYSSAIHSSIKEELLPPLFVPATEDAIKDHFLPKGDGMFQPSQYKENEHVSNKGYYVTTANYDVKAPYDKDSPPSDDKEVLLINRGVSENEKYINSKLQNKMPVVSSKPDGFDQIVTDLFHNVNDNKSDLVLELKDTYSVKSNDIQAKKAEKET